MYRLLVPGWSAKPLVSAHDRIMGTHRLAAWGRRRRGLLLVAVLAPVLGAEGYGVGVLVEDCAGEREDDDVGGCERA